MIKTFILCASILMAPLTAMSQSKIDIKHIATGKYRAMTASTVQPISGTDKYAKVSDDGKAILEYSYQTGKQTAILLDVGHTQGATIDEIDDFIFSPDGKKMLVSTNTERIYRRSSKADYYIYTIESRKLERLSDGDKQQAPVWSPDSRQVAFVRDNNIFLVKLLYNNSESQITKDGKRNEVINGVPDWVYEEEFSTNSSLVFTADSRMVCWIRYDEAKVPEYSLQLFKGQYPQLTNYATYPGLYTYKYPKAGEKNSDVSVWSFDIQSKRIRKMDIPVANDDYIPRLFATSEPQKLLVCTMNRHQNQLNIYAVNPSSTVSQLVIQEKSDKYIKEEVLEQMQIGKNTLLLPSDRDGYMHLYLYDGNGQLQRKIGQGAFDITDVYGMDEQKGDVYYQAARPNPMNRQIWVSHKNGKEECLTEGEGWNVATFSADFTHFVNTWSDRNTPYIITTRNAKGKIIATNEDNKQLVETIKASGFAPKEFFEFTTTDGVKLNGWMLKPTNFNPNKQYPVIMFQYSGPGSQQVVNSWNIGSMGQGGTFDQYLSQQGFIVACVDGRGTGGRGVEFEKCTYLTLGKQEAKDQQEAARYLASLPYVDAKRMGIWGWSFGGFCTLMTMSEPSSYFKAGVAVAPPTDWRFYDTVYTERYMRTPKENPNGYTDNPITRASQLKGDLLLVHGMADDNVHPQNTFEYAEALVQNDKDFKENYYTNRNHSIYGGNTRNHLLRQIATWFETHLK